MLQTFKMAYLQTRVHIIANVFLAGFVVAACAVSQEQVRWSPKLIPLLSFALFSLVAAILTYIPWLPVARLAKKQILFLRFFWFVSFAFVIALTLVVFYVTPLTIKLIFRLSILALSLGAFSFLRFEEAESLV
jgi:hypothetical protein